MGCRQTSGWCRWGRCCREEVDKPLQPPQLAGQVSLLLHRWLQQQWVHVAQTLCKLSILIFLQKLLRLCLLHLFMQNILKDFSNSQQLSGWDKRNGFEISAWHSASINPNRAVSMWRFSPGHNDVILGKGGWSDLKTVGCSWRKTTAHCWFSNKKLWFTKTREKNTDTQIERAQF